MKEKEACRVHLKIKRPKNPKLIIKAAEVVRVVVLTVLKEHLPVVAEALAVVMKNTVKGMERVVEMEIGRM